MITEFWIEKATGDSIDNVTIRDAKIAIEEIKTADTEHGAFWIGHIDEQYVLEIHKNLDVFLIYGENQDKRLKSEFNNWEQVENCLEMYFTKDFLLLKNRIGLPWLPQRRMG